MRLHRIAFFSLLLLLCVKLSGETQLSDIEVNPDGPYSVSVGYGQSTVLDLDVSNTNTTETARVGALFADAISADLKSALDELNTEINSVLDLIPDRYAFSDGVTGTRISDGGRDMYDGGNYLRFDANDNLYYSDNMVNLANGVGYFTRKYEGLFVLGADYGASTEFHISGNLGADGAGTVTLREFDPGHGYRAFFKVVHDAWDPSINHLILVPDGPGLARTSPTTTYYDTHSVTGLPQGGRLYYLLFAKASGETFLDADVEALAEQFLSIVENGPEWFDFSEVTVAAGTSVAAPITLDATGLNAGVYTTDFTFGPAHLSVDSVPADQFTELRMTVEPPSFTPTVETVEVGSVPGFAPEPVDLTLQPASAGLLPGIVVVSSEAWVMPEVVSGENTIRLSFNLSGLEVGTYMARLTITSGTTTRTVDVELVLNGLDIVKVLPDPMRPRLYALNQNEKNQGNLLVFNSLNQQIIDVIPVGNEPTDLDLTENSEALLIINTSDPSIQRVDLSSLAITATYELSEFSNRNDDFGGHVADGPGDVIYYVDEQWGPRLRVFDTSSETVLQTLSSESGNSPDTTNNYGYGDIVVSPDRNRLFGWSQYGDGAGNISTAVIGFDISAEGRLVEFDKSQTYLREPNFEREPFDTPAMMTGDGAELIIKSRSIDQDDLDLPLTIYPDEIYSISPGGEIASGTNSIYSSNSLETLYDFPRYTSVQTVLPDYSHLVYFNTSSSTLTWLDLEATIGLESIGLSQYPVNDTTIFQPEQLSWLPISGYGTYNVYFGTNPFAVASADPESPEFLGVTSVPYWAFQESLELGTSYFWRVDGLGSSGIEKGRVHRFKVASINAEVDSLELSLPEGAPTPTQTIHFNGAAGTSWSASSTTPWLEVLTPSGTTETTLQFSLDTESLAAGRHSGSIQILVSGSTVTFPVELTIQPLDILKLESNPNSDSSYALSATDPVAGPSFLLEIDPATASITDYLECGRNVVDFSLSRDASHAFVLREEGEEVVRLNLAEWTSETSVPVGVADRIIAAPDGNFLLADRTTLHSVDAESGDVLYQVRDLPNGYGYTLGWFSPDEPTLYLSSTRSNYSLAKVTYEAGAFSNLIQNKATSIGSSTRITGSTSGSRIFTGFRSYHSDLNLNWYYGQEILSTDSRGVFCVGESELYWTESGRVIGRFGSASTIVTVSGDDRHIVRYDPASRRLETMPVSNFITLPGPSPQPGERLEEPPLQLSVPTSQDAIEYRFYFGSAPDALSLLGSSTEPRIDLTSPITNLSRYYWRVDLVTVSGIIPGEVHDFALVLEARETNVIGVESSVNLQRRRLLAGSSDYPSYLAKVSTMDPETGAIGEPTSFSRVGGFSSNTPFGETIVEAGGDYFTLDNDGIYRVGIDEQGFVSNKGITPLPEDARPSSLQAAGDLLYVSSAVSGYPNYDHVIYVYRTFPELNLEATIQTPEYSDGAIVRHFGSDFSAHGDHLAVRGYLYNGSTSPRVETEAVWIYRRNHATSTWALVDRVAIENTSPRYSTYYNMASDDGLIVASTNENSILQVSILREQRDGSFEVEAFIDADNFPTMARSPIRVVADQDQVAIALPRADLGPRTGAVFVLQQEGAEWNVQEPLFSLKDANFATDVALADGWLATLADEQVLLYDLADENIRPLITSPRPYQLVRGRDFEIPLSYADTEDDTVEMSLAPNLRWASVQERAEGYVLTGRAPLNLPSTATLRITATDLAGASDTQTFDVALLSPDDVPVVESLPGSETLGVGQALKLSPEVSGTGPFTWQWYKDGNPIPGATGESFSIRFLTMEDAGTYTATITNAVGTTETGGIVVEVRPANRFAGDWPMFGGGPAHLGFHPATLETHRFVEAWSQPVTTRFFNRAAIGDNKVFVTAYVTSNRANQALCYDLVTGNPLWSREFAQANSLNPPSYHDGKVYIQRGNHNNDSQLWALRSGSGATLWSSPFGAQWQSYESPTVTDDGIWINGGTYGGMYGFDLDGTERFFAGLPQYDDWTPTYSNGSLYSWVEGVFIQHDPGTGVRQWFVDTGWDWRGWSMDTVSAVTDHEALLISTTELICLDLESRAVRWRVEKRYRGSAAVDSKLAYAIINNQVESYDLETGAPGPVYTTGEQLNLISGQPLLLNDHLIVATSERTYVFEIGNTTPIQTLPAGGFLSYSEGYLMIAGWDGTLTAYYANDVPDFIANPPDITADAEGSEETLDISQYVFDADVDDQLKYAIVGNTNPEIFSNIMIGATDGQLNIQFAPYVSGSSDITIRVSDLDNTYSEYTLVVTLPPIPGPEISLGPIEINRQAGLYEQTLTVTNIGGRAIGGFEVQVSGLENGYQLFGYENGLVGYYQPIEAGDSVELILQYYSPSSRALPEPEMELTQVMPEDQATPITLGVPVDRILVMDDGTVMIEFPSVPGHVYAVQYSYDMEVWYQSSYLALAGANRTQWFDDGMPKTDQHPSNVPSKFYRVLDITD